MAESITNRGKFRLTTGNATGAISWRAGVITGTQTGVHSLTLNTVADLDAVTSVGIHTERLTPGSMTVTEDDANSRVNVDSADLTFAAAPGVTAQGVIFYDEGTGADSGRDLISVHTTGFPQPMDGGLNVTVADIARLS
jgi:hypothetical protein